MDLWYAQWEAQAELHDCGHPHDVCSDPDRVWYPQRTICRPAMEQAAASQRYADLHSARPYHDGTFTVWSERASAGFPYHFNDGVTIFVAETDLNPSDNFLAAPEGFQSASTPLDDDGASVAQ